MSHDTSTVFQVSAVTQHFSAKTINWSKFSRRKTPGCVLGLISKKRKITGRKKELDVRKSFTDSAHPPVPRALGTYFCHFLIRCLMETDPHTAPIIAPDSWAVSPSAWPVMKTEEREAGMCLPAWNAAGAESWHQLGGKGLASKGCLHDNRVFSLWCIYTVGLKFCESNSCCKNIVLNMLRTVKRVLLVLHFAREKCGDLWYVWRRVSALSEAVL